RLSSFAGPYNRGFRRTAKDGMVLARLKRKNESGCGAAGSSATGSVMIAFPGGINGAQLCQNPCEGRKVPGDRQECSRKSGRQNAEKHWAIENDPDGPRGVL